MLRSALGDLALFSVSNEEIRPVRELIVEFPVEICRIAIMWSRKTKIRKESELKTLQNEENSAPFLSVSTGLNTTLFFDGARQVREICVSKLSSMVLD